MSSKILRGSFFVRLFVFFIFAGVTFLEYIFFCLTFFSQKNLNQRKLKDISFCCTSCLTCPNENILIRNCYQSQRRHHHVEGFRFLCQRYMKSLRNFEVIFTIMTCFNLFSTNVPLMDKPGSQFLLVKCLKNACKKE